MDNRDLIIGFMLVIIILLGAIVWAELRRQRAVDRQVYAGTVPTTTTGGIKWRKVALYGSLVVFAVVFLGGAQLFPAAVNHLFGVSKVIDPINATPEQVEANHFGSGWVLPGTLLSKLFAAVLFYCLSYTLPWLLQRSTHPAITKWAKDDYSKDFEGLTPEGKFSANGRLQINQSIRIAAALIAASQLV